MGSTGNASYSRLMHQLAQRPPSSCRSETIDFMKEGLLDYNGHFAVLIHDAFSLEECKTLLEAAESTHQWEEALVNVGNGRQALYTDVRLCDRILWDERAVAAKILERVMPHLPKEIVTLQNKAIVTGHGPIRLKETWEISRLNDRLRFLKYTKGGYFRPHCDGTYQTPDKQERSFVTVHLYLNSGGETEEQHLESNDDAEKPLIGGATRFLAYNMKDGLNVDPKAGSILVFQHRNLMHSGEDVEQGTKYTVRSDILYRRVPVEA